MTVALVTGANGFLGRYVQCELAKREVEAVALCRSRSSGYSSSILLSEPPTRQNMRAILDTVAPSMIFHLAGTARTDTPEDLYQANVFFAVHLLEAALTSKSLPTVVLVGSAAEYGQSIRADCTVRETDPCTPLSPYGISKLAQTHHGLSLFARGLPVVVARLFNPIGVGAPPTTALGSFVNQLGTTAPMGGVLRTGPLNAVRDFVNVADAARALVDLAETPNAAGQVVNICTGVGNSVQYLVDRLIAIADLPIVHEVDGARHGTSDIDAIIGDTTRHRQLGIMIPPPNIDMILREMFSAALVGK
jgi:GDP-4-dehydro-6-deoxy-D-mannose reductase